MTKKVLTWGGICFLIFFVAIRPDAAANVFKSLGSGLASIAAGFRDFFVSLIA